MIEGCFKDIFHQLSQEPFVCQIDTVIAEMVECYAEMNKISTFSHILLDFGCGRIYAGLDTLTDVQWSALSTLSVQYQGYARLVKAPEVFCRNNDVFGQERPEWHLSHQIKKALDPENIFSPGALPGRV